MRVQTAALPVVSIAHRVLLKRYVPSLLFQFADGNASGSVYEVTGINVCIAHRICKRLSVPSIILFVILRVISAIVCVPQRTVAHSVLVERHPC